MTEQTTSVSTRSENRAAPAASRLLAQGKYELLAMLKNGEQLMLNIAFPIMALLAMAWTSFLNPFAEEFSTSRINVAVPGVLALCVISTALSGQGIATGFDRRYGVLRFLSTTPLGRAGLIVGKIIAVVAVLVIQVLLVSIVGLLLGWTPHLGSFAGAIPTLLLGAAAFTALGLLIAGTVRAEATLAIVNMAWALLAAGGGTLIPAHNFPGWLAWIINLLPSGALGNALRGEFLAHDFLLLPHLILVGWTVLCGALSVKFFKWSA